MQLRTAAGLLVCGLLPLAAAAQISLPVDSIQAKLTFEAASVRQAPGDAEVRVSHQPGRFVARGMTIYGLLQSVLGVPGPRIAGGPDWARTVGFNSEATAPGVSQADIWEVGLAVLEHRFSLRLRREVRRRPIYVLTRVKQDGALGPRLRRVENCTSDSAQNSSAFGRTVFKCSPWLAGRVTRGLDRPVLDRTGLTGLFDLELEWSPEMTINPTTAGPTDIAGVSLFTALREQLAQALEPTEGDVEVLVIDSVERPTEN